MFLSGSLYRIKESKYENQKHRTARVPSGPKKFPCRVWSPIPAVSPRSKAQSSTCGFPEDEEAPAVYDCIITFTFDGKRITLQTAEHLGPGLIRCISFNETLNLQLGALPAPIPEDQRPSPLATAVSAASWMPPADPWMNPAPTTARSAYPSANLRSRWALTLKRRDAKSPNFWKQASSISTFAVSHDQGK